MIDAALMGAMLDSLKDPFLFVDTDHVIQYMNKAAITHYEEGAALVGRSLLDCHKEESKDRIRGVLDALLEGADERLVDDGETKRVYMRAVRDGNGRLLGYYERYEATAK